MDVFNMFKQLIWTTIFFYQIVEFVQKSKGWKNVERVSKDSSENIMMNVSEEELYNLPTAEYVHRQAFVYKQMTIYHVAIHACADLKSKEVCLFCLCVTFFALTNTPSIQQYKHLNFVLEYKHSYTTCHMNHLSVLNL